MTKVESCTGIMSLLPEHVVLDVALVDTPHSANTLGATPYPGMFFFQLPCMHTHNIDILMHNTLNICLKVDFSDLDLRT